MYTIEALLDIHQRMQRNMAALLEHCSALSEEQLNRKLEGFGFPTIAVQLFHIIATELWGMGVLRGEPEADLQRQDYTSIAKLEALRQHAAALTADYLARASAETLSMRSRFEVDPGVFDEFVPAHMFMRLLTHQYHHQGQVLAMCRQLGHPRTDETPVDFPID